MNEAPQAHDKFYIAVRRDLSPGQQLAQAVHASIQFGQEWPDLIGPWYYDSNFLVVVSLEDETALMELAENARTLEIRYSAVQEPDFKDAWTAVALEPGETARLMCTGQDLALRNAEEPKVEEFY